MNITNVKILDEDASRYLVSYEDGTEKEVSTEELMLDDIANDVAAWLEAGNDYEEYEPSQVEIAKAELESYIYGNYPQEKQLQDQGWQSYAQTVIVGATAQTDAPVTTDALTREVLGAVVQIYGGALTIDDYIAQKPEALREHYKKLVKIGLRLKWTKDCIDEFKSALTEGREPNYKEFIGV